jgi:hypothetical protein
MPAAAAVLAVLYFRAAPAAAPLVRFTISPPAKGTLGQSMALSPDGRFVAFSGSDTDGVLRLWLRSLDSLEVGPVAGTEGASPGAVF